MTARAQVCFRHGETVAGKHTPPPRGTPLRSPEKPRLQPAPSPWATSRSLRMACPGPTAPPGGPLSGFRLIGGAGTGLKIARIPGIPPPALLLPAQGPGAGPKQTDRGTDGREDTKDRAPVGGEPQPPAGAPLPRCSGKRSPARAPASRWPGARRPLLRPVPLRPVCVDP